MNAAAKLQRSSGLSGGGAERSFTKAAAKLGVSQSALSQTIRGLEARLGLRLLTRTTRSVSPTEAGERLLRTVGPRFEEIEAELAALSELRDKPAGTIRITRRRARGRYGALARSWRSSCRSIPDIKVEINIDYGLTDIVAAAFRRRRAPRRAGGQGHDRRAHRAGHAHGRGRRAGLFRQAGRAPKKPQDLVAHDCINLRLPTLGGLYAWEFEKGGRELKVRVEGQLIFNGTTPMLQCGAGRIRPGLPAGRPGAAESSPTAGWCACSRTGARPIPATTSIIRAAGNLRRPLTCWWTRCGIGVRGSNPAQH